MKSGGAISVIPIQLELSFNPIEFKKGWVLADNPRRLNNTWATKNDSGICIIERLAVQFKSSEYSSSQRFSSKTYLPIISTILANLLNAHRNGLQVIYSRCTRGGRSWVNVWNFLADAKLIRTVIAEPNDFGVQSWAEPLPALTSQLLKDKARIIFDRKNPSIEIRDAEKKVLPMPKHRATKLRYLRAQKGAEAFNSMWEGHTVTLDGKYIVPFGKRIFNNSLAHGGRFYCECQRIPSKDRKRIKIDGQETIELDYSCIHLAILYAWKDIQIDYDQAYMLEGYERATVKAITLRMFNVEDIIILERAGTLSANPRNQDTHKAYKEKRPIHDQLRSEGLPSNAPNKPQWIDSFIENIPSNTDTKKLIKELKDRHSDIKEYIGSPSIGLRLQNKDSEIMALVLDTLRQDGILALPVHDSIIIQKKSKGRGTMVMQNCFKKVTRFRAEIK